MSGNRVCALLGELGYGGADALDPDSFEWPFQYEDAGPLLDWICSSLPLPTSSPFLTSPNAGLEKVWDVKPLVNGKDIMTVLQLKSGGPLQQKLLAWQLAHPTGTAEECLDWMKETHLKRAKME
ncbi:unnamed protein product [Dovyalis caffra]|uniref:Uncharacterized protein n=1 Tax=Dovyalis caffra TaxID=77055 RepID=A0AAV1RQN8_9ROSI|nr:unnamed protein product [Dovyalis caffra]